MNTTRPYRGAGRWGAETLTGVLAALTACAVNCLPPEKGACGDACDCAPARVETCDCRGDAAAATDCACALLPCGGAQPMAAADSVPRVPRPDIQPAAPFCARVSVVLTRRAGARRPSLAALPPSGFVAVHWPTIRLTC